MDVQSYSERVKVETSCDCLQFSLPLQLFIFKEMDIKGLKEKSRTKENPTCNRSTETNEENAKRNQVNNILKSENVKMPPPIYLKHKKS